MPRRFTTSAALLSVLLAALLSPAPGVGQRPSFGPLTSEEGAPLQRVAYTPMMEGADVAERDGRSLEIWQGWSNIFEQDSSAAHVLFVDMERLLTAATFRWGVSDAFEVGARVTLETTGAGVLDGPILGWHDLWGFGNANRDRFPEDSYRAELRNADDDVLIRSAPRRMGLADMRLSGKWQVARSPDERSLMSIKVEMRVPGNTNLAADGRTDGAVMALARLGVGSWYLHGMLGASAHRVPPELEGTQKRGGAFLTVAVERSLGSRLAALAQLEAQSATLSTFDHRELDQAPTNLVLGLAGTIGDSWRWNASFQEDVPADTPAVDFTLTLAVRRSW